MTEDSLHPRAGELHAVSAPARTYLQAAGQLGASVQTVWGVLAVEAA